MQVVNILPADYIEHPYFNHMLTFFDPDVFRNKTVLITHEYDDLPQGFVPGKHVVAIATAADEWGKPPKWSNKVGLVFKHQFDRTSKRNVFHIPLPYALDFKGHANIPINMRKWDVSFIGRDLKTRNHAKRALLRLAAKRTDLKIYVKFTGQIFMKGGLSLDAYAEMLSDTKFAISLHGWRRPECLRLTEAVKCGCAVIACKHPANRTFKNTPAFWLNNRIGWSRIEKIIDRTTPEKLEQISELTKACYHDYYSPEAVGKYISDVTEKYLI